MQIWELFGKISIEGDEGAIKAIDNVSNGFTKVGGVIQKVGMGITAVGAVLTAGITMPLVKVAKTAIETTMDFDLAMSKMQANARLPQKDFEKMRVLAQRMGQTTSKTASEAADALGYMALAGWDVTQMTEGLEPILRASEAGMMDLGLTSDLVTDSMSALGIGTQDLSRYLDIAANSQSNSNQSMQQFLEAMVTAGGTFKMFNVPLEEAGALLGILANRGIKGSEAGNALISIMSNLTTGTGQAGDAMKELGIEIYDSNGEFRGMSTVLQDLNTKFAGMTEEQRNTYIQMIGGKTRTKELNALLAGTSDELEGLTSTLYDSEGALNELARTMQDNTRGAITRLQSAFEGILIIIGDRLMPVIDFFAAGLQKVADIFLALPDSVVNIILVLAGLAAGVGPVVTIIGTLIIFIGTLVTAISTIGAPVIAAIAAIAGLIGILGVFTGAVIAVLIQSGKMQSIMQLLQDVFERLKPKISEIVDVIRNYAIIAFDNFSDAILSILPSAEQARAAIDTVIEIFKGVYSFAMPIIKQFIETIKSIDFSGTIEAFQNLKSNLDPIINVLKVLSIMLLTIATVKIAIFAGAWNAIIMAIDPVIAIILSLVDIVRSSFGLILGIITGDINLIVQSCQNGGTAIINVFKNLLTGVIGIVKGLVSGIVSAFRGLFNVLVGRSIIPDMVNAIIRWFNNLNSKVISIISGFTKNLRDRLSQAHSTVKNIFDKIGNIVDRIKGKFDSLRNSVTGVARNLKNIKFPSVPSWVPGFASGVRNFSGGMALVGERGPELVSLPRGSNVYTAAETKTKLSNAQQGSKTEIFNVQNISINASDIKDISDVVNIFKNIKSEATARGY